MTDEETTREHRISALERDIAELRLAVDRGPKRAVDVAAAAGLGVGTIVALGLPFAWDHSFDNLALSAKEVVPPGGAEREIYPYKCAADETTAL